MIYLLYYLAFGCAIVKAYNLRYPEEDITLGDIILTLLLSPYVCLCILQKEIEKIPFNKLFNIIIYKGKHK
jgi:hypothetical protein